MNDAIPEKVPTTRLRGPHRSGAAQRSARATRRSRFAIWRSVAAAAAAGLMHACAPAALAEEIDRTLPADPRGQVAITNVAGGVTVAGWNRPEIAITGMLGDGVERLDVQTVGTRTTIKVILPRNGSRRDGDAQLQINMPAGSALELSSVSADLRVAGVDGALMLRTVSGDIESESGASSLEVKSVSGDVRAAAASSARATARISTVSGNITLRGGGDFDATTVSGDVEALLEPIAAVRVRTTSGDVTIRGPLLAAGRIDAESVSGDLSLKALGPDGFVTELSSFSGDIRSCFGAKPVPTAKYGPGSRLDATVGKGSGRVRAKSMSGDISICNRGN